MNSDTISVDSVCFRRNDFNLYAFLLFCVIMYLCFIVTKCRESFIQNTSDNVNSQLNLIIYNYYFCIIFTVMYLNSFSNKSWKNN